MEELLKKGAVDRPEDYSQPRAWRHSEIAGAFRPVSWKEKAMNQFVTYPKRNQQNQSTCVAYALAKQLAVDELSENKVWRELSPRSVYPYVYAPGGGSSAIVATKLVTKQGMTLEHLLKNDGLTEGDARLDTGYATDAKQIALVYKPSSYVEVEALFDTIASVIQEFRDQGIKKVVTVTVIGTNNGTWMSAFPKPLTGKESSSQVWYHRVTVTDYGLINGKKYLSIDNSWGEQCGNKGQQFLSIDHQPYIYGGIYTINMPDNWQQLTGTGIAPPKWEWKYDLSYGAEGIDVEKLQIAMQSIGMFPVSSIIKPTGRYYGMTQKSVEMFQASFGLPVTGSVDARTRAQLNSIFKA